MVVVVVVVVMVMVMVMLLVVAMAAVLAAAPVVVVAESVVVVVAVFGGNDGCKRWAFSLTLKRLLTLSTLPCRHMQIYAADFKFTACHVRLDCFNPQKHKLFAARIGSTHVAHHVCAAIPFYKAFAFFLFHHSVELWGFC